MIASSWPDSTLFEMKFAEVTSRSRRGETSSVGFYIAHEICRFRTVNFASHKGSEIRYLKSESCVDRHESNRSEESFDRSLGESISKRSPIWGALSLLKCFFEEAEHAKVSALKCHTFSLRLEEFS